jgi:hypothetical protein
MKHGFAIFQVSGFSTASAHSYICFSIVSSISINNESFKVVIQKDNWFCLTMRFFLLFLLLF